MFEKDTFFFNPQIALNTALKQNEIETIPGHPVKALQLCYYIGDKLTNSETPKNCIHIELENLYNYFVTTKNRFPQIFDLNSNELTIIEAKILADKIFDVLNITKEERNNLVKIYAQNIINQQPDFNDEKLRIFIPTIREATVIKHVSSNLADAFESMGYEVFFYLPDELGNQFPLAKYHYMYEFNPHIVVTVDFIENQIINENSFFFCWMQDPMPILTNNQPIEERKNDFYFVLQNRFKNNLIKKGINSSKIAFQPFATNTDIFYENKSINKQEKIVFLGSDYNFEKNSEITKECINEIIYHIDNNSLTKENVDKIAIKYNFDLEYFDTFVIVSIVRRRVIEWLCSIKNITIEVYGTDLWLSNKIVSPYYKGLLPYGKEMAKVYNSSSYAIAVHPHYRYQQRIMEISSCGSIPIVYKGHLSSIEETFIHDDNILSFSTLEELKACIGEKPIKDSRKISLDNSYKNLVNRIIQTVKENI